MSLAMGSVIVKNIINVMVNMYGIKEYGLDFMGFRVNNIKDLSYHHLIISKEKGGKETVENGAILIKPAHKYLHFIENNNKSIFKKITDQMIIENRKGVIDLDNLVIIDRLLLEFEEEQKNEIKKRYPIRFLREIDRDILDNIDKYELKKNLR